MTINYKAIMPPAYKCPRLTHEARGVNSDEMKLGNLFIICKLEKLIALIERSVHVATLMGEN